MHAPPPSPSPPLLQDLRGLGSVLTPCTFLSQPTPKPQPCSPLLPPSPPPFHIPPPPVPLHIPPEFERLGISDQPLHEGSSQSAFPANTNILYVGLAAVRAAVDAAIAAGGGEVLPGLIFNLKKKVGKL